MTSPGHLQLKRSRSLFSGGSAGKSSERRGAGVAPDGYMGRDCIRNVASALDDDEDEEDDSPEGCGGRGGPAGGPLPKEGPFSALTPSMWPQQQKVM